MVDLAFRELCFTGLVPGRDYELRFWAKGIGGFDDATPEIKIRNMSNGEYLHSSGEWSATNAAALRGGLAADNTWTRFALTFSTPLSHDASDSYRIGLLHSTNSAIQMFYDEANIASMARMGIDKDGLLAGVLVWGYTLLLPSFEGGTIPSSLFDHGPWEIAWLRPQALFGHAKRGAQPGATGTYNHDVIIMRLVFVSCCHSLCSFSRVTSEGEFQ